MLKNFVWISLAWLLFSVACTATRRPPAHDTGGIAWLGEHLPKYRVQITTRRAGFSGVMVVKRHGNDWKGTLVNEFGIKAFDFTVVRGACALQNTVSFLDKWYIRRTIERDWTFLFGHAQKAMQVKGKKIEILPDGAFILHNTKRNIVYTFYPLAD